MSNPIPLDLQAKIASWRLRAAEGTLTLEEMREAVIWLRAGRVAAASAAVPARKAKKAAPAADDLLNELEDL